MNRLHVIKKSRSEFYPTYKKWCESHDFPVVEQRWLPTNVFVCYNGEVPIYCIWFWNTDSGLCWIGFVASDYNVDYGMKKGGLDYLIQEVVKYAKSKRYVTIFTTSGTEPIIKSLEKNKFVVGDHNINQYLRVL